MESARVIREHFHSLLRNFPDIMQKLWKSDVFCFEYGRIQVPAEIVEWRAPLNAFRIPDKYSTATHSTESIPWKAADSEEVEKFWMRNDSKFAEEMNEYAGHVVTEVSNNFICINCPFHAQPKTVMSHLVSSKCSGEVFKRRAVKRMVRWRWKISSRSKQLALLVVHSVLALLFFTFTALYCSHNVWEEERDPDQARPSSHADSARSILLVCLLVLWFALSIVFDSLLVPYDANLSYIYWRIFTLTGPPVDVMFLISFQCLLILISILQALRPFRVAGPFVSVVYYTLWDIIPFLLLGALTIVSFGMALLASTTEYRPREGFVFGPVAERFETLLYAIGGDFSGDWVFGVHNLQLRIWSAILRYIFGVFGSIVLLSLLIAALGDTFDRVVLTRVAESIKSRAAAVECRAFSCLYWTLSRLPFLRCCWRRPSQWFDEDISWMKVFDCLLLRCRRSVGVRHRLLQLQKLQEFADSTHSSSESSTEPPKDVLLFHFLVPAESDADSLKRPSWHGRILALGRMIERAFEKTCKSLDRNSGETKRTLADVKSEIEAVKERTDETERRLTEQFDALQARMERMENNHRTQFEALMGRVSDIAEALR